MSKELALRFRDRLNGMVEEALADGGQEAHIIACCLAVGIEELEKWIYDGQFTPSVAPYRDDRRFEIPFKEGEDGNSFVGVPWDRKRMSVFDRYPSLSRIKKSGVKVESQQGPSLSGRTIADLSKDELYYFRNGDTSGFLRQVRLSNACSLRVASDSFKELRGRYHKIWGIDSKPGDKCPNCQGKNISDCRNSGRLYVCADCKIQWGHFF